MKNNIAVTIATWFGCGFWPWGPGTAGSIGALLVAWPLVHYAHFAPWHFLVLSALATPLGIWSATITAQVKGKKDPGLVVVDEVLGQWIALAGAAQFNWPSVIAAFLLFRAFDIAKPWPVRKLESFPQGTGIVADDLGAGVYAALVLWLARNVVQF